MRSESLPLDEGSSRRPLMLRRSDLLIAAILAAVLLIAVPALYAGNLMGITSLNNLGRFLCLVIMALGLDLVWGYAGVLSLCQAMFFCFGGYAIGMHMALHGPLDGDGIPRCLYVVTSVVSGFQLPDFWKPFRTLPGALALVVLVPGFFAFVFGYFAFRSRVRGVYFSIITQALTLAACLLFRRNDTRLCGTNGLTNFVTLGGFDLTSPKVKLGLYVLTVLVLIAVYLGLSYITRSRLGRLMVAVRDNETRLRFAGYQPVTIKLFAFVAGAVIAGIAGALYTPQNGIITPFKMEPIESIMVVIWVAVGGRGTLLGAVVGSLLVTYLISFTTSVWPTGWLFVPGGLAVAVVLFFPDGLVGTARNWLESRPRRDGRPSTNNEPQEELEAAGVTP